MKYPTLLLENPSGRLPRRSLEDLGEIAFDCHSSLTIEIEACYDRQMAFQIEQIAELARLSLKPEEKVKLQKEIEAILAYVDELQAVPTDHVEPTSHVLNLENVFREDRVHPTEVRDETLKHAPHREGNFFKVPKVIEQE